MAERKYETGERFEKKRWGRVQTVKRVKKERKMGGEFPKKAGGKLD